jgi:AraC-like DNA-binding protein
VIVTLRTEDVPTADRFEWWREQAVKDTVPTLITSPHTADFRAVTTLAELGPVRLAVHSFPEVAAVRTPALIRRCDAERYGLLVIRADTMWMTQRDHVSRLRPGDVVLYDTSQPYDVRAFPGPGHEGMLMMHFPKALLPLRPERLNELLAYRLPGDTGMSTIFAQYLDGVASAVARGEVGEPELRRLGEVALDLAAATLAAQLDAQDQLAPETRSQALLSRIEAFIELNLGDPDLTPTAIAEHHHISTGYLHRLFQPRELTAAAWIRRRRLERCHAALADPRLRHHPVHAIGARWGLRDPAHFSRAFRTAYGITPGDRRRQALTANGTDAVRAADPASTSR